MKDIKRKIENIVSVGGVDHSLINRTLKSACLAFGLFSFCVICVFLNLAKNILIPFAFGALLAFLVIQMTNFFHKKISRWVAFMFSVFIILFSLGFSIWILNNQIREVIEVAPVYQVKFLDLANIVFKNSVVKLLLGEVPEIKEFFEHSVRSIDVGKMISILLSFVKDLVGVFFWASLFAVALISEYRKFNEKAEIAFDKIRAKEIIGETIRDIKKYFAIKFWISLGVAFFSFWVLYFFGINFVFLWVMLLFILNFIPIFGSIIAVSCPVFLSLLQFDDINVSLALLVILVMIQIFMAYWMEPKIAGDNLNLSLVGILLALLFWGYIWQTPGIFLCVPLTGMINIILSKNEHTRWIAIMLSKSGNIPKLKK